MKIWRRYKHLIFLVSFIILFAIAYLIAVPYIPLQGNELLIFHLGAIWTVLSTIFFIGCSYFSSKHKERREKETQLNIIMSDVKLVSIKMVNHAVTIPVSGIRTGPQLLDWAFLIAEITTVVTKIYWLTDKRFGFEEVVKPILTDIDIAILTGTQTALMTPIFEKLDNIQKRF